MKSSMRSRLEQLSHRLIEIDAMLAEPDIATDMDRFRQLTRERSEIEPVVDVFQQYTAAEQAMHEAQELMDDPEMKGLAEDEYQSNRNAIDTLEGELQILLLPRDPDDSRSAFLVIRAGTGGAGTAL